MRRLLVLATVPFLSACAGGNPAGDLGALEGTVFRAPATPTCAKGQSCSKPAPGVTLRLSSGGSPGARITTRADGTYKIGLAPGRYAVRAAQPVRPRVVEVARRRVRRVDFTLETRIR
jgi:hypothetical protein